MSTRILPEFDMLFPQSVNETLELLSTHKERATVISGGSDLVVAMKINSNPDTLISIADVDGLDYIEFDNDKGLRVGARTTISQLLNDPNVNKYYPALIHAAEIFATPQIRNSATLIGNILRGSPAGDGSAAAMALGGRIVLQNTENTREVSIDNFWTGYNQNARNSDELAIEVIFPAPKANETSSFKRMTRVNEDLAKLNAAVRLQMTGNQVTDVRLSMGCVGPVTLRLHNTEKVLIGNELTDALLEKVAATVSTDITPIDDKRSTSEYRQEVAGVVLTRLIQQTANQLV